MFDFCLNRSPKTPVFGTFGHLGLFHTPLVYQWMKKTIVQVQNLKPAHKQWQTANRSARLVSNLTNANDDTLSYIVRVYTTQWEVSIYWYLIWYCSSRFLVLLTSVKQASGTLDKAQKVVRSTRPLILFILLFTKPFNPKSIHGNLKYSQTARNDKSHQPPRSNPRPEMFLISVELQLRHLQFTFKLCLPFKIYQNVYTDMIELRISIQFLCI